MAGNSRTETATLGDYGRLIRRRWRLVILGILIGLALAAAYLYVTPKSYQATATVLVQSVNTDTSSTAARNTTGSDVNLDTEAQLVKSAQVTKQAVGPATDPQVLKPGQNGAPATPDGAPYVHIVDTSGIDIAKLPQQVGVTVPANTSVLKISFSATGGTGAAQNAEIGANAYAQAYLAVRGHAAYQQLANQIRVQQQQIKQTTTELTAAKAAGDNPSVQVLNTQLAVLQSELSQLIIQQDTLVPGTIVNKALVPASPVSPNRTLIVASGFMLGLLLGLFLAWWAARRDPRIYVTDEIEEQLELPVLGEVPVRRGAAPAVLTAQSAGGQALARVRNVLLARLPDRKGVFTVAGATSGTGPDMVAANLAASFARADLETILLVADPTSCAPALLGAAIGPGLAEVLRQDVSPSAVLRPVESVTGLRVLSPGAHLATEVDDLEGAGVGDLVAKLRAEADVIVIVAPATSHGAEAQIMASDSDAAVVVVELGRTERDQLDDAFQQFEAVGTVVPGAVTMARPGAGPRPFPAGPPVGRLTTAMPPPRASSTPPPSAAATPTEPGSTTVLPSNEGPHGRFPSSGV
jgi:capsular polysaccharide biosynthesis protein